MLTRITVPKQGNDDFASRARAHHEDIVVPYPTTCLSEDAILRHRDGIVNAIETLVMSKDVATFKIFEPYSIRPIEYALGCTFWECVCVWAKTTKITKANEQMYSDIFGDYMVRIIQVIEKVWSAAHPSTDISVDWDYGTITIDYWLRGDAGSPCNN